MKADVLNIAIAVFVVGMIISGIGKSDLFDSKVEVPPEELHQGVVAVNEG